MVVHHLLVGELEICHVMDSSLKIGPPDHLWQVFLSWMTSPDQVQLPQMVLPDQLQCHRWYLLATDGPTRKTLARAVDAFSVHPKAHPKHL